MRMEVLAGGAEGLAGGADQTAALGSTSEYLLIQKTQARSKCLPCHGCREDSYTQSTLIHPGLDIKVVMLQWDGGRGKKEETFKREFCEPWQRRHLCPCKLPEQCKCLGNTHEGAQNLHSHNTCHHCQDIRIINNTRSNINPKGIPKLASPKEQLIFLKQAEMFFGGKVMSNLLFLKPFLIL